MAKTSKKATNKTVKASKAGYLSKVLANLNKDEKTKQKELLADRLEDFKIEAEAQISLIDNSELPKAKQELKKAKRDLTKANKSLEASYYSLNDRSIYASFVEDINTAKEYVERCERAVSSIESELEGLEAQKAGHQEILDKLNS
jgi:hypothetical protein